MKKHLILSACIVSLLAAPTFVRAQEVQSDSFGFGNRLDNVAQQSGYDPSADVPLEERVGSIIATVLSFLGVIFMILMLWAGFNWMTAAGEEEKITRAKDTIRAAIIGLIIVIASYAASVFIIERIWGTTSGTINTGGAGGAQ